eukprot:jgi/Mesen1/7177/ME000037S06540
MCQVSRSQARVPCQVAQPEARRRGRFCSSLPLPLLRSRTKRSSIGSSPT